MVAGLELARQGDALAAVIDCGEENLLTGEICAALTACLRDPPSDAHVLLLAARGPCFCLGRERRAETPAQLREEVRALVALNQALSTTRLATVAQVHGDAAGFGVGLAALCDVTVAAPSARFWFPEVDIDLAPVVVLAWLPRLVGRKQALYLTQTGRKISAARAAEIGLVTSVSPSDAALEVSVRGEVAGLAEHAPRVHAEISAFLRASSDLSEDQAYDLAVEKLIIGSMERKR